MTALLIGAVVALLYVLGWLRGYQSYKESPERLRQLRDDADRVATAALKRAVKVEEERDWWKVQDGVHAAEVGRLRAWFSRMRTAAASAEYLQELAAMALDGKEPWGTDPVKP